MESDSMITLTVIAICVVLGVFAFSFKWETKEEREYRHYLEWQARQKLYRPDDSIGGGGQ